jgi:hypothetical protein
MIETVVALLMLVNNEIMEHRIQDKMSNCLKGKRLAERTNTGDNIAYKCGKVQAELEENIDGSKSIKKIVSSE